MNEHRGQLSRKLSENASSSSYIAFLQENRLGVLWERDSLDPWEIKFSMVLLSQEEDILDLSQGIASRTRYPTCRSQAKWIYMGFFVQKWQSIPKWWQQSIKSACCPSECEDWKSIKPSLILSFQSCLSLPHKIWYVYGNASSKLLLFHFIIM